jgi:hypothetical protein
MLKDIMRVLELFSGTGSVGKMCKELGWEVISLDLKGADINTNILQWDYTQFPEGHFDIVWASPPCDTFSNIRRSWVGRKMKCHGGEVCTLAMLENDMNTIGVPILERTEEIIDYFQPKKYFIENPQTGRMKDFMMHHKHYDVDYCRYSDWGYRKRTRIWTNVEGFIPKICDGQCGSVTNGKHVASVASQRLSNKYRIPLLLVRELLTL